MTNADSVPVTPKQLARILKSVLPSGAAVMVHGQPGIGKTEIHSQVAAEMEAQFYGLRAPLYKPEDVVGLPWREGERTKFCPPTFMPDPDDERPWIFFIDEIGQAEPSMQKVFMQAVHEKRIGEYRFPKGTMFSAATNRAADRAGVSRMITPLLNRFVHFDLVPSTDEWLEWAARAGVPAIVRAFIAFRREMISTFDPSNGRRAFATPRAWQTVGKLLAPGVVHDDDLYPAVAGTVGAGEAAEFMGYFRDYKAMPSIEDILKRPSTHPLPSEPSVTWAVCSALADRIKGAPDRDVQAAGDFLCRLDSAFTSYGLRSAAVIERRILKVKSVDAWFRANFDALKD